MMKESEDNSKVEIIPEESTLASGYILGHHKLNSYNWLSDIPSDGREYELVEVRFKNTRKAFYRKVWVISWKRYPVSVWAFLFAVEVWVEKEIAVLISDPAWRINSQNHCYVRNPLEPAKASLFIHELIKAWNLVFISLLIGHLVESTLLFSFIIQNRLFA